MTEMEQIQVIVSISIQWLNMDAIRQDIDGEAAGDNSGRSVSLSSDGSIVAIGAHKNDGNGTDSGYKECINTMAVVDANRTGD